MAGQTIKTLSYKKIANCKVLSNRIQNFSIQGIEKQVRLNMQKMEDFFYDSYKGFYCAMCDYDN